MSALKTTSESLCGGKVNGKQLLKFAGPQCCPQVRERVNAGLKPVSDEKSAKELNQWRDCWLCCSSCKKMRLVREDCMPAVCPELFKGAENCPGDVDWRSWMQMAEERYKAFAETQQEGNDGDTGAHSAPVVEVVDATELHGEESAEVEGDLNKEENVEAEEDADHDSLGDFIESDASQDYPSDNEMAEVKRLVGSYAGPMTEADRMVQARAEVAESVFGRSVRIWQTSLETKQNGLVMERAERKK